MNTNVIKEIRHTEGAQVRLLCFKCVSAIFITRTMLIVSISLMLSSCSLLWKSSNSKVLGTWNVESGQRITARTSNGQMLEKRVNGLCRALLLAVEDTLVLEPEFSSMPVDDNNPITLDKSDSTLTLFAHNYLQKGNQIEADNFRAFDSHFDIDAITVPFRYRFRQGRTIPGGFVSNPNVGVYAGWRTDFITHGIKNVRNISLSEVTAGAVGFGAFSTVNPVYVSPWNTDYGVDVEYDGLGMNYGFAVIVGYQQLTLGLLLGFELLLDENNVHWVFHNKPWVGVSLGLNLN